MLCGEARVAARVSVGSAIRMDPLAGLVGIASASSSSDDDSEGEAAQHLAKRARTDSDEESHENDESTGSSDEDEEAAVARRKRKRLAATRKPVESAVGSGIAAPGGLGSVDELFAATDSSFLPSKAVVEVKTVDREQEQAEAQAAAKVCLCLLCPCWLVGWLRPSLSDCCYLCRQQ